MSPGRPVPDEATRLRILRGDDFVEDEAIRDTDRLGDSDSERDSEEDRYSVFEKSDSGSDDSMSLTSLDGGL